MLLSIDNVLENRRSGPQIDQKNAPEEEIIYTSDGSLFLWLRCRVSWDSELFLLFMRWPLRYHHIRGSITALLLLHSAIRGLISALLPHSGFRSIDAHETNRINIHTKKKSRSDTFFLHYHHASKHEPTTRLVHTM